MLWPELRVHFPVEIEQHQNWSDVVPGCDEKKRVQTSLESFSILFPKLILKENTDSVHSDRLLHSQLFVNQSRVERRRLKHLQFVDGIGRNKVCTDEPGLTSIPLVRTLCALTFRDLCRRRMRR
jgi:hypothetical protein